MDALAFVLNLQRLAVIALAFALVAGHVDIGQEVHLNLQHAVALAGLAAAAAHVKAEAARIVAARTRFRHACEQLAHRRKDAGVGRRVGARRAADWALVDIDHFIEVLKPVDLAIGRRFAGGRAVQMTLRDREQRIVNQRRFTRAGDAGDTGKQADRQRQRHIFQVVAAGAAELQRFGRIAFHALLRHRDLALAAEELAGQRLFHRHDFVHRAFRYDLAAVHAGAGPISITWSAARMASSSCFDHNHGIAEIAQVNQGAEQALVVALMQAD